MARIDARFFGIRWCELERLTPAFWEDCIDQDGELRPECHPWLIEELPTTDMANWKVALDAAATYEDIRRDLPAAARAQADALFSQLFGLWDCDEWPGFEQVVSPDVSFIIDVGFDYSIRPALIDTLLDAWRPELRAELRRLFPERPQNSYIPDYEAFAWHVEGWLTLLRSTRQRGDWGLLVSLSY